MGIQNGTWWYTGDTGTNMTDSSIFFLDKKPSVIILASKTNVYQYIHLFQLVVLSFLLLASNVVSQDASEDQSDLMGKQQIILLQNLTALF